MNRDIDAKVPIVHFSLLVRDTKLRASMIQEWEEGSNEEESIGRIDKSRPSTHSLIAAHESTPGPKRKKQRLSKRKTHSNDFDPSFLPNLPVVVCVAMYRTNGILEKNVQRIGRTEGVDLWHFS